MTRISVSPSINVLFYNAIRPNALTSFMVNTGFEYTVRLKAYRYSAKFFYRPVV